MADIEQQKPWAEKTADEKLDYRLQAWLNPPVTFASPEAAEAYQARVRRLADAILLEKTPDRVPVPLLTAEVYPAVWGGLTPYDAMYDYDRASKAFIDFNVEFQPDAMVPPGGGGPMPGRVLDLLDHRVFSWPGHGAPKELGLQCIDRAWMDAEEYDDFISDPTDFLTRRLLPRVCGGLQGLARLGCVLDRAGYFASWADPDVLESLERLVAVGKETTAWFHKLVPTLDRLQGLGFPPYVGAICLAPFDFLGNDLRGTKELALDLYRRPEKVIDACNHLVPMIVRSVMGCTRPNMPPCVFWPLHRGADALMSLDQFKTFYWPSLRAVALALIDEGFIPVFFGEGSLDSRLEIIASDLPRGRTVWLLDRTDMALAKATLGKVAAIQGNVPLSLLQFGTPEAVRAYCRALIEVAGPGGGFLLDSGAALHEARAENVRAMIQAAQDYGVY